MVCFMTFVGDPAREVFKDALQDIMVMCQHVRSTFDKAVADYKAKEAALIRVKESMKDMDIESE